MTTETQKRTGWDTGLCQDYNRKLSMWFASRIDARHVVRKVCAEIAAQRRILNPPTK